MAVSVFDLFTIGIGPSSSHTVGPMRAARFFARHVVAESNVSEVTRIHVEFFGSLGLTGKGHGSGKAIVLGLLGERPDKVDPDSIESLLNQVMDTQSISLMGQHPMVFNYKKDLTFNRRKALPFHANGMVFKAFIGDEVVQERSYYSVGGGFIVDSDAIG